MSKAVAIIGRSGTGKSRSIKFLPPEETYLINILGKELPIRGANKLYSGSSAEGRKKNMFVPFYSEEDKGKNMVPQILSVMDKLSQAQHIKYIVIDDFQYLMAIEFMLRARESGWEKFNNIGLGAWSVLDKAKHLREDQIVFVLSHIDEEGGEFGERREKFKTIGKMLDNTFSPEGMFTIVLRTNYDDTLGEELTYHFVTNGKGIAKSPEEMFDLRIPNDLKFVADGILSYYQ